jgi:hypothetical protein
VEGEEPSPPGGLSLTVLAGEKDFPPDRYHLIRGDVVSKYRLIDAESGMHLRHYVRSMREADREREWYERHTGRRIRIVKVFESRPEEQSSPPV